MLLPELRPCQSADKGDRGLYARRLQTLYACDQFFPRLAFFDHIQDPLAAGFRAHVDHLQSMRPQLTQLLLSLAQRILGTSVGGYPFTFRELLRDVV